MAWLLVLGCLSTHQLNMWRSDEAMLGWSLREDVSDWRIVDLMAEHLLKNDRGTEAVPLLERTLVEEPAYSNPIKMALSRGKNLVLLGKSFGRACIREGDGMCLG